MVFKVQDGIEFETRAEWRKYMMDTYYSCKNQHGAPGGSQQRLTFIKGPGSIGGQMFNISDCSDCQIVIMDHCEQVQIDNVQNCNIFIGASASTIFVRNCDKCTIYCCGRQIRLRECFDCAFYVFSPSEVHIELSKHVVFAPFMGSYAQHKEHLAAAKLNIEQNLWYQVYDHNDPDKTNANWSLLPVKDRNSPWFPDGSADPTFPGAAADEGSSGTTSLGQVGESFGIDRMIKDQKAAGLATAPAAPVSKPASSPTEKKKTDDKIQIDFASLPLRSQGASVKQLGIEVALLIAAATVKGINHTLWLQDSPASSAVPAVEFNAKLTSLGLAVGIQESWDAKRELDLATSKASLKNIFSLCGYFSNDGVPMIDVSLFLRLASDRVQEHLKHIQGGSPGAPGKAEAAPVAGPSAALPVVEESSKSPTVAKVSPKPPASPRAAPPRPPSPLSIPIPKETEAPVVRKVKDKTADAHVEKPKTAPVLSRFSLSEISFGDRRPRAQSSERIRRSPSRASTNSVPGRARSKSRDASVRVHETKASWSEDFESIIKKTVQQADLYHLIQVYYDIKLRTFEYCNNH
jgi:protein XRP2